MKTENLMIRITAELKKQLKELAQKRGQTVSDLVTDLIKKEIWTAGK